MTEIQVLKEVAGSDVCDFCREQKDDMVTIGPFGMELPTHICAPCYHKCIIEIGDQEGQTVSDWLNGTDDGLDELSWKIISEIHIRSLYIKEKDENQKESIISVGELPDETAEYVTRNR